MRSPRRLALFFCLAFGGCASAGEGISLESVAEQGAARETVRLTIDNQNFKDATIYVRWNGARSRIGTVIGKTLETFEIEWEAPQLVLEVDFLAGSRHRTARMDVTRGDHLRFILGPN